MSTKASIIPSALGIPPAAPCQIPGNGRPEPKQKWKPEPKQRALEELPPSKDIPSWINRFSNFCDSATGMVCDSATGMEIGNKINRQTIGRVSSLVQASMYGISALALTFRTLAFTAVALATFNQLKRWESTQEFTLEVCVLGRGSIIIAALDAMARSAIGVITAPTKQTESVSQTLDNSLYMFFAPSPKKKGTFSSLPLKEKLSNRVEFIRNAHINWASLLTDAQWEKYSSEDKWKNFQENSGLYKLDLEKKRTRSIQREQIVRLIKDGKYAEVKEILDSNKLSGQSLILAPAEIDACRKKLDQILSDFREKIAGLARQGSYDAFCTEPGSLATYRERIASLSRSGGFDQFFGVADSEKTKAQFRAALTL